MSSKIFSLNCPYHKLIATLAGFGPRELCSVRKSHGRQGCVGGVGLGFCVERQLDTKTRKAPNQGPGALPALPACEVCLLIIEQKRGNLKNHLPLLSSEVLCVPIFFSCALHSQFTIPISRH